MAQPQPRSYNQILGDMVASFLAKKRLPRLKALSPTLTFLEAAAQSDTRQTQDGFAIFNAVDLNRASGTALARHGADERTPRLEDAAATGQVTFSDSSIVKKSTRLSAAKPAPIAGSVLLYLTDAEGWATAGSVYLGRGTPRYEGPLAYSALSKVGDYWEMTLSIGTQRLHLPQETVVLAQGGDRVIPAGTRASTPVAVGSATVEYTTLFPAVIPDGEQSVSGVYVVCSEPGSKGNASPGAISTVPSPPFPGCAVTNPTQFVTGTDTETEDDWRERIRNARENRSKATESAIQNAVISVASDADGKRVVSASIVKKEGQPMSLFIDDGTGYEPSAEGVAIEPLIDSAVGGEDLFQLSFRPIAKAQVDSTRTAPYDFSSDVTLSVVVGGIRYDHSFSPSDFSNSEVATAYEVVASINSNPLLGYSARTAAGGTGVSIFSKQETNENIEVASAVSADANDILGFPSERIDTVRLYKNDKPLNKDGTEAALLSNAIGSWGSLVSGETLTIGVDKTAVATYTFVDADFVDAGTTFASVGINTPKAWADAINYKIPGVTASVFGSQLLLTSNKGRAAMARLRITGGSLVTKNVFETVDSRGADKEYTLDRSTGEISLTTPLVAGDSLAAGSFHTRAFVESASLSPVTLSAQGNLWVVVDGNGTIVSTGIGSSATFSLTKTASGVWGERWALSALTTTPFSSVASGQWLIVWDANVPTSLRGVWRVAAATTSSVSFDTPTTGQADVASFTFASVGVRLVSATNEPQNAQIPAATNYTAEAFATALTAQLSGATATVYRTSKIRLRTNDFGPNGSIAIVGQDTEGAKLGFAEGSSLNVDGHLASTPSEEEVGTPDFVYRTVASQSAGLSDLIGSLTGGLGESWGKLVCGLRNRNSVGTTTRWGNNEQFRSAISDISGSTLTLRKAAKQKWAQTDTYVLTEPFRFGPDDSVVFVADGDDASGRFVAPMSRTTSATGSYGSTITLKNTGALSLARDFGLGFDFSDFAVFMRARTLTHAASASQRILWRWKRYGADGNAARIRYAYPTAANAPVTVEVENVPVATAAFPTANAFNLVTVRLPSGAARTGLTLRPTTKLGYGSNQGVLTMDAITVAVGFTVATATRTSNVTVLTLTLPSGLYAVTDHGLQIGDQIFLTSSSGSFSSGLKTITARTATTVSFADVAANAGPIASIGTVSRDVAFASFGTSIVAGDIARFDNVATIPSELRGRNFRVTHFGEQFIQGYADSNYTGSQSTSLAWATLSDSSAVKFYPLDNAASLASAIAASVNALATSPVTATVTGTGAGAISLSSREEASSEVGLTEYTALTDGVNWVKTSTSPGSLAGDYTFLLKAPVSGGLLTNSDWTAEAPKLVPVTAANVAKWLNSPTVTGLSAIASIDLSAAGRGVQVVSSTPGSGGSIECQGGLANEVSSVVKGSASVDSIVSPGFCSVNVASSDDNGWTAGQWVAIDNAVRLSKLGLFSTTTALTSIAVDGQVVLSAGPALFTVSASGSAGVFSVTKIGGFVALAGVALSGEEGDWIYLSATGGSPLSAPNTGLFRIVRRDALSNTVWVENPNAAVEEGTADWKIIADGSLLPGDEVAISTSVWGAENQRLWKVASVGVSGGVAFADPTKFVVDTSAATPVATGVVAALGTEASKIIVTEGTAARAIKRILSVGSSGVAGLTTMKFDTGRGAARLSEAAGSVVSALDKLGFATDLIPGRDGYRYSTGLLAEVNRVVYGDPRDESSYPGVAGAGQKIVVQAPLTKRISLALSLRIRLGFVPSDVLEQVRSAVAAVVNAAGIGKSIAISSVVNAAASVNGIVAVSVESPVFDSSNDLIVVKADEKPLILDAKTDISLSVVGD